MYANSGYAVVATDYAGLGTLSGTAVIDMQSNALDVIYSVVGAREAVKEIGPKWMAVGPFQGGLAAAGVAEDEAHDSNYLGSIVTSGLADLSATFERLAHTESSRRTLLDLAASVQALYPEFQVRDMLADSALPIYDRASEECGAQIDPPTVEVLKPNWENNRFIKEFFSRNTPGQKPARAALLVISGGADVAITTEMSEKTVARMCKQGDRILFLRYPNLDASGAMGASVAEQITWIRARFAGDVAPVNCR
jgi:hypothetical protein